MLGTRSTKTNLDWIVYISGFVITILAVFYINHLARKALKKYLPDPEQHLTTDNQ